MTSPPEAGARWPSPAIAGTLRGPSLAAGQGKASREQQRTASKSVKSDDSSAAVLARQLFARAATGTAASTTAGGSVRVASERTCRVLSRSLGASGFHALLTRSLEQARHEHPLLVDVRVRKLPEAMLGGLPELDAAHGGPAVDAALGAMLVVLLELLGRLIGDDMVARLVDQADTNDDEDDR